MNIELDRKDIRRLVRMKREQELRIRYILSHLVPKRLRFSDFTDHDALAIYFAKHPMSLVRQKEEDGSERLAIKYCRGKKLYWLDFDSDIVRIAGYIFWRNLYE